jgi:hypothetical protein
MRSTKSEWFSRLRSGAGGKASRRRPSVLDDHTLSGQSGSFARSITALKLWFLSTLPLVQLSRSAPDFKARPPGEASAASVIPHSHEYEEALLENLKADTRLKKLQAEALEDERDLQPLKQREHEVNVENGEIKRDLTLAGVVLVGAMLVAGLVLQIADPSLNQPNPNLLEFCKLLLGH